MIKLIDALNQAKAKLSHLDDAHTDALCLLTHIIQKPKAYFYAHTDDKLTEEQWRNLMFLVDKRAMHIPIAYLIGHQPFWTLDLNVTPDVLIPRPETELIIEYCLNKYDKHAKLHVLDLGTGSGAIALALASEFPKWEIDAVDMSESALKVAKSNADKYQLAVRFIHSDWFMALEPCQYDLIVSNPPYIEDNDPHLVQGDLPYEPLNALASGPDGLKDIKVIIQGAKNFLKTNGLVIIEHGFQQPIKVQDLLKSMHYDDVRTLYDLQNHPRVTIGVNNRNFALQHSL